MRKKKLVPVIVLVLSILLLASSLGQNSLAPAGNGNNLPGGGGRGEALVRAKNLTITIYNATHVAYLRTAVFTDYENGHWVEKRVNSSGIFLPRLPHHTAVDRIRVVLNFNATGVVPLPLHTTSLSLKNVSRDNTTLLVYSKRPFSEYTFTAVTYTYDFRYLLNLTPGKAPAYLNVSPQVMSAMKRLLDVLNWSNFGWYYSIVLFDRYLLLTKKFVKNPRFPIGVDRVIYFLQNGTEGNSYDFSSAIVFFARAMGVPARLVEGYRIEPYPGKQVINASKRTYWVELYFNRTGWVTFDPLNPEMNLYMPLRAEAVPQTLNLTPSSTGTLSFHLLNVYRLKNLTPVVPEGFSERVSASKYSVNVTVRALGRVLYPVLLRSGKVIYWIAWVKSANEIMEFPRGLTFAYPGGISGRELILLRGDWRNATVSESEDIVVYPLILTGNSSQLWFSVSLPENASPGLRFEWIELRKNNVTVTIYLPVLVVPPIGIQLENSPYSVQAGNPVVVRGNVTVPTGETAPNGEMIFGAPSQEWYAVGVTNASGGHFNVTLLFPKSLKPGTVLPLYVWFQYTGVERPAGYIWGPIEVATPFVIQGTKMLVNRTIVTRPGSFVLSGRLVDLAGRGVPNATIYYSLNSNTTALGGMNVSTDAGGNFVIPLTLGIGENTVFLLFPGNLLYNHSSAEVRIYGVNLRLPNVVKTEIGKTVLLRGTVEGLENGILRVTYGDVSEFINVTNGTFVARIGPFDSAGEFVVYVWGTNSILYVVHVAVHSPLRVLVLTKRLYINGNGTILLRAVDGLGNPVPAVPIHVIVGNLNETVYTNQKGEAFVYFYPERPGALKVRVIYPGSTFYSPATFTYTVEVVEKKRNPLVYALPLIGLVGFGVLLYYRRRRTEIGGGSGPVGIVVPGGVPIVKENEEIELKLLCDGELKVDGKVVGRGKNVRVRLSRGIHVLELNCGNRRFKTILEVVPSYNEAVCRIYEKCFLSWAARRVPIESLTPREIEEILRSKLLPGEALERIRRIFEEAKYGRRELSRGEFVEFYRSVESLTGVGCSA
ncbi:transglutaminase domain-containing protein [Thermococcus sp.]